MAEELTRALVTRAERGTTRGAEAVLSEARQRLHPGHDPKPWWRSAPAFAVAFAATLALVGAVLLASRLLVTEAPPADTVPVTTPVPTTNPTPTTSVTPTTDPPASGEVGALDRVFDLALAPDGALWAATDAGVVRWDLETRSPTVYSERDGLPGRRADHIAVGADATVWVAGNTWIARFDGSTWTALTESILPELPHPIGDLAAGADGAVWVAAGLDSLIRIDGEGTETFGGAAPSLYAEPWSGSLAVDVRGTVWATTWASRNTPGVHAFDGSWRHYGVNDGLPSGLVGNMAVARDGSVWVGGAGAYREPEGDIAAAGISRFDGSDWTTFTTANGLLSDDGDVVIGSGGDVWVVHTSLPEQVAESLEVYLPSGLSRYYGERWEAYPDAAVGRGRGAVVSAAGTLWMPSMEGIIGFDSATTVRLIAGSDAVPPPGPPANGVMFEHVPDLEPVRLATSIGELEFTTYAIPEAWGQLWWLTGTAHGVVGTTFPGMDSVGSLDGYVWSEIPTVVSEAQLTAFGDDLLVSGWSEAARLAWDGTGWSEIGSVENGANLYGTVAGPRGIVGVRGTSVVYSQDGTEFLIATDPPQPSLHTLSSVGCVAPGWVSYELQGQVGPMVATDDGFVALAATSGSPICEPVVWTSPDGDGWTLISEKSPFGERAFIHDMTAVGDTIVAIGGVSGTEAAVWVTSDGVAWERVDLEAAELWQVAGGERGWILSGSRQPDGEIGEMWFSPDGRTWDGPHVRPLGWGDRGGMVSSVVMLDDRIVGAGKQFNNTSQAMDSTPARVVVGEFIDE